MIVENKFTRYCRPRLQDLIARIRSGIEVNDKLLWEVLLEVLSTIKVAAIKERTLCAFPVQLLSDGLAHSEPVVTIHCLAGWLVKVQVTDGKAIAIKVHHPPFGPPECSRSARKPPGCKNWATGGQRMNTEFMERLKILCDSVLYRVVEQGAYNFG